MSGWGPQHCKHVGTVSQKFRYNKCSYFYEEAITTPAQYTTEYRYRDRNAKYTYYFYRDEWSAPSPTQQSPDDQQIPVYYYCDYVPQ